MMVGRQRISLTCTAATVVCVCVLVRAHACVRDVFAIYDNNIWPRLIMLLKLLSYISYQSLMIPLNGYPSSRCNRACHNLLTL